jgi:hypothetical protein
LVEQEEALVKDVLTRKALREPALESAHLILTDTLAVPPEDDVWALSNLLDQASKLRPDLSAANFEFKERRHRPGGN